MSSILGRDSDNRVYGIAKNKRAYMMFDTTVNTWVSIPKSMVSAEANKYIKLTDAAPAGDPVSHQVIGSDHWGGKAVFQSKVALNSFQLDVSLRSFLCT